MSHSSERRAFQLVVGTLAIIPLGVGPIGMFLGLKGFHMVFGLEPPDLFEPNLDSDFRFLAAAFFGLGLLLVWVLLAIEERTTVFRLIVLAVFLGGVARLCSVVQVGSPNGLTWMLIVLELCCPLLVLWQARLARLSP